MSENEVDFSNTPDQSREAPSGDLRVLKETSSEYGRAYQMRQAEKYLDRDHNHWKLRIELAERLVDEFVLPRLAGRDPEDVTVVDVGCSIGTFAIEFARKGYRAYGIDFDPVALEIARDLSAREGVSPTFVQRDVADWGDEFPPIDVAVCFDIFEHLHDDELGAFLTAIRRQLSDQGAIVFHTFPSQYDHLFYGREWIRWPLWPFKFLPVKAFERVVKAYSAFIDVGLALATGQTYRERLRVTSHCNPLSPLRLTDILRRSGYEVVDLATGQLHPFKSHVHRAYAKNRLVDRNIWGVAVPKPTLSGHHPKKQEGDVACSAN